MNVLERIQAPTPKFFRVLRTIGIALASAGGTLLAAPLALPAALLTVAGYLTVAGSVLTVVSQTATESSGKSEDVQADAKESSTLTYGSYDENA